MTETSTKSFLKLKSIHNVPPGGFFWIDPLTKFEVIAGDFFSLIAAAKKHRTVNKLEIPPDFREIIEDTICRRSPPNFVQDDIKKVTSYIATSDVLAKTQVLMAAAKANKGVMLCATDEAKARAEICVACPMNVRIMCPTCNGVLGWMRANWHLPKLDQDNRLVVCRHGHILNKAQVHLHADVLRKLVPPPFAKLLPETCWKRKLILGSTP